MWVNCDFGFECKTDIKYIIDDYSLNVKCTSSYPESGQNIVLIAHFFGNDQYTDFELGKLIFENGVYSLEGKYTLSDFVSSGIDAEALSHFSLSSDGNIILKGYPAEKDINPSDDVSIKRARQTLDSLKTGIDFTHEAARCINYISNKIKIYKPIKLPFLNDFDWYVIDRTNEYFNLSIIRHLLNSENYSSDNSLWYFGKSKDKRIYAAAVKYNLANSNPFSNANDCTVKYSDNKTGDTYYIVGILLLDDGQYFCIPD